MKTLKIKNSALFGILIVLPLIGETKLSDEGTFKTDNDELVDLLLTKTEDWELVSKNGKAAEIVDETAGDFESLSLDELVSIAQEMKYPKDEWSKYKSKQKLMVVYLNKKKSAES